jgi:hypothetical protein
MSNSSEWLAGLLTFFTWLANIVNLKLSVIKCTVGNKSPPLHASHVFIQILFKQEIVVFSLRNLRMTNNSTSALPTALVTTLSNSEVILDLEKRINSLTAGALPYYNSVFKKMSRENSRNADRIKCVPEQRLSSCF